SKKMSFPDFQLLESEKLQPTILEVECILREATPEQLKNVRVLPAKRVYEQDCYVVEILEKAVE
ncbi:32952_t:CDS:2, partial [Gigaspora margarita]